MFIWCIESRNKEKQSCSAANKAPVNMADNRIYLPSLRLNSEPAVMFTDQLVIRKR